MDTSNLAQVYSSKNFIVYSEDDIDYTDLIHLIEQKKIQFESLFNKFINPEIKYYLFKDQDSFLISVFGTRNPDIRPGAISNVHANEIYLTSYGAGFKTKDEIMKIAVHELVHQFFMSPQLWISEGIAEYYSDRIFSPEIDHFPDSPSDLPFWGQGAIQTSIAYNISGWLIKYLLEIKCEGNLQKLLIFAENPSQRNLLGFKSESELIFEAHRFAANYASMNLIIR